MKKHTGLCALAAAVALAAPALALGQASSTVTGSKADRNDPSNTHLRNDCFDPGTKTWKTSRDCLALIPDAAAPTTSISPAPGPTIGGAATGNPDTTSGTSAMRPPTPMNPTGSPNSTSPNPSTTVGSGTLGQSSLGSSGSSTTGMSGSSTGSR